MKLEWAERSVCWKRFTPNIFCNPATRFRVIFATRAEANLWNTVAPLHNVQMLQQAGAEAGGPTLALAAATNDSLMAF